VRTPELTGLAPCSARTLNLRCGTQSTPFPTKLHTGSFEGSRDGAGLDTKELGDIVESTTFGVEDLGFVGQFGRALLLLAEFDTSLL